MENAFCVPKSVYRQISMPKNAFFPPKSIFISDKVFSLRDIKCGNPRPPDSPSPCSPFHCSQNRPSKDAAHSLQAIFERQTCYADQPPWYLSYPKGGCHAHPLNPLSPFTASENGFACRICASSDAAHAVQKKNTCDKGKKHAMQTNHIGIYRIRNAVGTKKCSRRTL